MAVKVTFLRSAASAGSKAATEANAAK
jgi:hypothetical protein